MWIVKTGSTGETNTKNIAPIRKSHKQPSLDRINRLLDKKKSKKALKVSYEKK